MTDHYIDMDVNRATTMMAVMDDRGRHSLETTVETQASSRKALQGSVGDCMSPWKKQPTRLD